MNTSSVYKRALNLSASLFWRLFISLLLLLLVTSTISVSMERWMNTQALESRMALQIEHLSTVRLDIMQALMLGNYNTINQIYRRERGLRDQILIVDEQGVHLSFRFRPSRDQNVQDVGRGPEPSDLLESPPSPIFQNQNVVADISKYPGLADQSVITPDGYNYTVQLQPRLPLRDLIALQKTHFPVRVGVILLFSLLACYWFSRALSKRIRKVQFAVHRISAGDYLAGDDLSELGDDELGALAKDVAKLSDRLVDSELSRKQMLSDISHELRSPLARLDVATELTRDYAPETALYLDRIQRESARMNELIAQIINIQSLQMQRYKTQSEDYESVDIGVLLNDIGQDVCFEFQDKNIEWQCQFSVESINTDADVNNTSIKYPAQQSYTIFGNKEQLHSAFENIIRNAFIYSKSFSTVLAKIELTTTQTSRQNKRELLKVSIIDQGEGIAEANLARIFEPFVRLDTSRQRPKETNSANGRLRPNQSGGHVGGYGLGLAIAHAIAAAHKGHINAKNRQDGMTGLIVEVALPVDV
ncbi:sensor histidine kinase [Psychrobacter sp. DM4]|uniref:sensor histidine kinase n=1 Tax=Psychrobacter sp. DM4 TaxID=3440637 RepID=UPI003F509E02